MLSWLRERHKNRTALAHQKKKNRTALVHQKKKNRTALVHQKKKKVVDVVCVNSRTSLRMLMQVLCPLSLVHSHVATAVQSHSR